MDKATLLAWRIPEDVVELDDVGTVKVRGMARWELVEASKIREGKGDLAAERYILATCMLDPVMGEDDVAAWQKNSLPPVINKVAAKINELSGVGKGADKSGVPEAGSES